MATTDWADWGYDPQPLIHGSHSEDAVSSTSSISPILDQRYHLEFCTFQVDDRLFKVPKRQFVIYPEHFSWLSETDEDTSHYLRDVEKADFQAFLKVVYPLFSPNQPKLSFTEWSSVLKLASKWKMLDIRDLAIKSLDGHSWAHKIALAREHGVITWLRDGYLQLVERWESLSVEEAQVLGLESALKLINIREDYLRKNCNEGRRRAVETLHQYRQRIGGRLPEEATAHFYANVTRSYDDAVDAELSSDLNGVSSPRGADAIDRVLWAKAQNNASWLRLAYIELAERESALSLSEAQRLGLSTAIRICRARERPLRAYPMNNWHSNSDAINNAFVKELADTTAMNDLYRPQVSTILRYHGDEQFVSATSIHRARYY